MLHLEDTTFPCPGCGLVVSVRDNGGTILHAMPPCDRWARVVTLADAADLLREYNDLNNVCAVCFAPPGVACNRSVNWLGGIDAGLHARSAIDGACTSCRGTGHMVDVSGLQGFKKCSACGGTRRESTKRKEALKEWARRNPDAARGVAIGAIALTRKPSRVEGAKKMLKRGDWFKLQRGNDWGSNYWAREPKNDRGYCELARAYRLASGDKVRVRLLDGSERDGVAELVSICEDVCDMGHEYKVTSQVPRISFGDGTHVELQNAELQYDPSRDPTAAEISGA
jgi:hypothetical protein